MASVTKSMNMISTMGFKPVIAAPTAIDTMLASEIGVSRTRAGPKASSSPRVALNEPPASATSSPNRITLWSARIASVIAALTAWVYFISAMTQRLPAPA